MDFGATNSPAIIAYLENKKDLLKAVVSSKGVIYYDKTTSGDVVAKQVLAELRKLVKLEFGVCAEDGLNPLQIEQLIITEASIGSANANNDKQTDSERITDHIINKAIEMRASDLFIDTRQGKARLSFKVFGRTFEDVDGIANKELAEKIIRSMWMKGDSNWDPSGPCDCSFSVGEGTKNMVRVRGNSIKEEGRGNAIAARLRNPFEVLPLDEAGYLPAQLEDIRIMAEASGGLIVFAGPTDSGKSTSLTSLVSLLPDDLRKIEIADPPEVFLDHCTHVTIERNVEGSYLGLDKILGAIVRQNPDVLVLGEIRDRMSAAAAMGMAQQGKRVFTSLHANGCAGVPPRLIDLGIGANLLGFKEFFAGCVSQNLVAKLCPHCSMTAEEYHDKDSARRYQKLFDSHAIRFTRPGGCSKCIKGVKGQTLVAQVYPLAKDSGRAYELIRKALFSDLAVYMAKEHGVTDKHCSAALRIVDGQLDPVEVAKRIGFFPDRTYSGKRLESVA